jgi:hypothetical protein
MLCHLCLASLMLSVTFKPFTPSVIMLKVIMLNVIMLNVIMLSVLAPSVHAVKLLFVPDSSDK